MLLFSRFTIKGHSMEPLISNGKTVLISNIPYLFFKPKVGDVIAFLDKNNKKVFIKRITQTKEEKFFVLGDNRKDSLDSRKLGWIDRKNILGKVI